MRDQSQLKIARFWGACRALLRRYMSCLAFILLGLATLGPTRAEAQVVCETPLTSRFSVYVTSTGCQESKPPPGTATFFLNYNLEPTSLDFHDPGLRFPGGAFVTGPYQCLGAGCSSSTSCQRGETCTFSVEVDAHRMRFQAHFVAYQGPNSANRVIFGPAYLTGPNFPGSQDSLNWSFSFPNGTQIAPGQVLPIRFNLSAIDNPFVDMSNGSFEIGPGLIDPGFYPAQLPADGFCGSASTARSDGTIVRFAGLNVAAGRDCSFDFSIGALSNLTDGTVNFLTSTLRMVSDGSPRTLAALSQLVVKDPAQPPILSMDIPDVVENGGVMPISFRFASPYVNTGHTQGTFDFDPAAFAPGSTIVQEPQFSNCGSAALSLIGGATLRQIRGIDVSNGGFCTVTMSVRVPSPQFRTNYSMLSSAAGGLLAGTPFYGVAPLPTHFSVVGANENLQPATLAMQVTPTDAFGGVQRSIRYTLTAPAGTASADVITFEHDTAYQAAGVTIDESQLPANPCGLGSSVQIRSGSSSFFTLQNGQLAAGHSCSFEIPIDVPADLTPGSYTQLTGLISTTTAGLSLTSPAATAPWSVFSPEAATLSMQVIPASAAVGVKRQIQYTLSRPSGNNADAAISFQHDAAFQAAGVTLDTSSLPANPCGPDSSMSFLPGLSPGFVQLNNGELSAGQSCSFAIDINVPSNFATGSYSQLTGLIATEVNGLILTAPAVSTGWIVLAADTTPPVITASNLSQALDTGSATASVTLNASAVDDSGGAVVLSHAIGSDAITSPHAFPEGESTVTVRAEDSSGNVATDTFTVTTFPDQPLTVTSQFAGALLQGGQPVVYDVTLTNPNGVAIADAFAAVSLGDPNNQPTVGQLPAGMSFSYLGMSGSNCSGTLTQFPDPVSGGVSGTGLTLGAGASCTITVQVSASGSTPEGNYDVFGLAEFDNIGGTFDTTESLPAISVIAVDSTPPTVTVPADISVSTDAAQATATVSFSVTANDDVDGDLTGAVVLSHASGSSFPIGTTTVTANVSDAAGNAATQVSFDVTVNDTEAPVLSIAAPAPVTAVFGATDASGSFTATVTDNSGQSILPVFEIGSTTITSPHIFPIGTTVVTVWATDAAGNIASDTLYVVVNVSTLSAPIATNNSYTVSGANGSGPNVSLQANVVNDQTPDSDPDAAGTAGLVASLISGPTGGPAGGVLNLNADGSFDYTFANNAAGTIADQMTFTYRVVDTDKLQSNTATVTVDILAVPVTPNVPPTAAADAFTVSGGSTLNDSVLADNGSGLDNDPDAGPDPLSFSLVTDASHGVLTLNDNGDFSYQPSAGATGQDSFTYQVSDGADTASAIATIAILDTTLPQIVVPGDISVSTDVGLPTAAVSFNVTASDDVDGDLSGAVVFSHASGDAFPIGTTTVTADVSDAAGNDAAQASFNIIVNDTEAPIISQPASISVNLPSGQRNALLAFLATVQDNSGAVIVPVFRISGSPVSSPYQFPAGITTVTVDATDASGNSAIQAAFDVTIVDTTKPTIALSSNASSLKVGETAQITFTLSEDSTDFAFEDVSVSGGVLSEFSGSGSVYTATFTPTSDSTAAGVVAVESNRFTNTAGNANEDGSDADNTLTFTIDTLSPTAQIAPLVGPTNGVYSAAITLSEPSSDFGVDDLELENATAQLSGSGASFSAILTPIQDGQISITVKAGSFSDAAGNTNATASNAQLATYDGTAPTVQITGLPDRFSSTATLTASINFSEPVTGFEASDIVVTNASVVSLTGGGSAYTAQIQTTGNGAVEVRINSDAAIDGAGNGNTASIVHSLANQTIEETKTKITNFMLGRANSLVANQPDLTCHLTNSCGSGSAAIEVTKGIANFSLNSRNSGNTWFRLQGSRSTTETSESDYVFGAFGTHRNFGDNAILGVLFEIDHVREVSGSSTIEGTGWLVGPYYVAQHPEHPLFMEARLLAGMSYNQISPFGTYSDDFKTLRLLAQLKLSGQIELERSTITPSLTGSYVLDRQLAYTDGLSNRIAGQSVVLWQLSPGIGIQAPISIGGQSWTVGGKLSGVFSTSAQNASITNQSSSSTDTRARLDLSASTHLRNGMQIDLSAYHDGIGASGYSSTGVAFGLNREF